MWLFAKPILASIGAFLRGLPWQLWAGLGLLALGLFYGHLRYNAGQADVQVKFDAYRADLKAKTDAALVAARRAETLQAAAITGAVQAQRESDAKTLSERDRTIADLRSGARSLQRRFKCPAHSLPGTPASTGDGNEAGEGGLSDTDAEFLVSEAARADSVVNQLTACQAVIKADRL